MMVLSIALSFAASFLFVVTFISILVAFHSISATKALITLVFAVWNLYVALSLSSALSTCTAFINLENHYPQCLMHEFWQNSYTIERN